MKGGIWMTAEEYRRFLEQDFSDTDINDMADLKGYRPDRKQTLAERQRAYLEKVVNPYLVRIGNMKIKVRFANNGVTLEQAFENMLLNV